MVATGPGYQIGVGMVEISALATMFGAPSAEGLALGLRGAVGLPWASISTFGIAHVIKAMISCAISDRLREILGLRDITIDSAIGLDIPAEASKIIDWRHIHGFSIYRPDDGGLWGVRSFNQGNPQTSVGESQTQDPAKYRSYHTYAYDQDASIILSRIPTPKPGEKFKIHHIHRDTSLHPHSSRSAWEFIILIASAMKLLESYVLFRLGSLGLWWLTALPWGYSFASAIILHTWCPPQTSSLGQIDHIAGELPFPLRPGGVGKVILNLPVNVRRHLAWRIALGTGALINSASLLWVFVALSCQPGEVVTVWVAFQVAWMLARTVVHTFAIADPGQDDILIPESWDMASIRSRRRAVHLMMGLAKWMITIHPRGSQHYQHDLHNAATIGNLLTQVNFTVLHALPATSTVSSMTVGVIGVIGDTVLQTMTWVEGTLDQVEIYDTVLVFIRVRDLVSAIPSVRVLAGGSTTDPERLVSSFAPRGTPASGKVWWVYWIPVQRYDGNQCWMQIEARTVSGEVEGKILSSDYLHGLLQSGCWNIGWASVNEITQALEVSRKATGILLNTFRNVNLT